MATRYNYRLIQIKESYSVNEIAQLFHIDRMTCLRWIKYQGLKVIKQNTSPLLVMGSDLKEFIITKLNKRKRKLSDNEFFCLKCRKAVIGEIGSIRVVKTGKKIGKDNSEQENKIGKCEHCGRVINRFVSVYQKH